MGIEPITSFLPRKCSAIEPLRQYSTGGENRTPTSGFGDHCSTIELHPYISEPLGRIELPSMVYKTIALPLS